MNEDKSIGIKLIYKLIGLLFLIYLFYRLIPNNEYLNFLGNLLKLFFFNLKY